MGTTHWVEPTRLSNGVRRPVQRPTPTTYQDQINKKCADIESECNRLWRTICSNDMELDSRIEDLFISSYSTLPTMYTLVKTHKFPPDTEYSRINLEDMKVRPIVSCCGSPTEKLAWLVTDIISHVFCLEKHLLTCTTSTATWTSSVGYQRVNLKVYSSLQRMCQLCIRI